MKQYIIALDAMGGDFAPDAAIDGACMAIEEMADVAVALYGPAELLRGKLAGRGDGRLSAINAPDAIGMHEPPMLAVRRKPESSMVKAMLAVKEGEAHAFVSAGSTGAVLAGGMTRIGRAPGIERPALAPVLPGRVKPFLLIDCGANVDSQPRYLQQFGLMGSIYMQEVLAVADPAVGLINIGAEAEKGNALVKQAHELMTAQSAYRFVGNVEARDIPSGSADVLVADGFDGNLILKYTEGLAGALMDMLKAEMTSGLRAKLGAALLMPALRRFKRRMDYEEYGGAPLLGVNGAMVKAHGSSNARAIKNAIRQARAMAAGDVAGRIRQGVARLNPEPQS
ncbi:MAG: phosphate acyltransferase PlsX [Clostridiales bacterium]|nr:phosphate acyltransferase PlsX [Clostridiales bacterium]